MAGVLVELVEAPRNAQPSSVASHLHTGHPRRWRSFHRGGSVAVYIALYALGFLASSMSTLAGGIPILIYLCYMTILILGVYFSMGTVGFAASWAFVHIIFRAVKAD